MKSMGNREMCVKYVIRISAASERSVSFDDGNNNYNC